MSDVPAIPERPEGREALRPCPFCGAEATLSGDDHPVWKLARVSCSRCGTGGPGHFHNREAAVLAWNNRPLPPPARSIVVRAVLLVLEEIYGGERG